MQQSQILLIITISSTRFGRNYRPKHIELIVIINNICYGCN